MDSEPEVSEAQRGDIKKKAIIDSLLRAISAQEAIRQASRTCL